MIDALGAPASILLVGGTSQIGEAIVSALVAKGRVQRVILAARASQRRDAVLARVRESGVAQVQALDFDVVATDSHEALVDAVFADGDVDVAIIAAGVLPDQATALTRPRVAVACAEATYVGPMSATLHIALGMRAQGHGVLVVLSSVAAERPRKANFIYASAKAGLDSLATGLGDELHNSGVSVVVVRPGFVATRMTAGMRPAPFSTTADAVAAAVAANLTRGTRTVWVPGRLRVVMMVLRHLPRVLLRRLPE